MAPKSLPWSCDDDLTDVEVGGICANFALVPPLESTMDRYRIALQISAKTIFLNSAGGCCVSIARI